ncbi:hypothetical protein ACFWSF_11340 [Streptomyces sp. NPDC058611]|uniref:hypothetical protein n=1 Tax=unclassified Streptomyces TaxID=2593676 RepID=UPI0036615F26
MVGDAVVLTEEAPHRGASDDAGTRWFVTRLLGAATSEQRAEFESVMPAMRPSGGSGSGSADTDGRQPLNARTGALLTPYDDIPEFTSNGNGILRDEQGLFVFRATAAPAEGKS